MRYISYLIFFIAMAAGPSSLSAQETRYRVELLVLTHLRSEAEPREMPELIDYSAAVDFLTPVVEEDTEDTEAPAGDADDTEAKFPPEESPPEEDPNRLEHIEQMSSVMEEAWRRLRLSAPFRPQQYLSWEQGSQEPFPALRVHDLETVLVDDPWADQRAVPEEQETVFTDTTAGEPDLAFMGPPLPDPTFYYRLDGTATLIRTRFLHLELDLQLREAVWEPDQTALTRDAGDNEETMARPTSFLVHTLHQSRQVRTGRMEYFDGPMLGVLAYITEIKPPDEEEP